MKQSKPIVVVTEKADVAGLQERHVLTADEYLDGSGSNPDVTVINLCRCTTYGTKGYYVSLLADARAQHVLPTVQTLAGLAEPYARFRALQEAGAPTIDAAEMVVRKRALESHESTVQTMAQSAGFFPIPLVRCEDEGYAPAESDRVVETLIYLGTCADARFQRAARAVFSEWPAPLLRMLALATARADGDASVPEELKRYPARSRAGKALRLAQ